VTYFIFAGDMLVMLFMVILVIWVFWRSSDKTIEQSARIPLEDEVLVPSDE
jgi:cbb3-type cytochrome oxidase subunit 3